MPPAVNIPAAWYPVVIEALHYKTRAVVWTKTITEPGPVYIPPLKKQLGHPVTIRITYATGKSTVDEPVLPQ